MSWPIRGKNCSPFGQLSWTCGRPRPRWRSLLVGAVTGQRLRGRSLSRRASWETLNPETDNVDVSMWTHTVSLSLWCSLSNCGKRRPSSQLLTEVVVHYCLWATRWPMEVTHGWTRELPVAGCGLRCRWLGYRQSRCCSQIAPFRLRALWHRPRCPAEFDVNTKRTTSTQQRAGKKKPH